MDMFLVVDVPFLNGSFYKYIIAMATELCNNTQREINLGQKKIIQAKNISRTK